MKDLRQKSKVRNYLCAIVLGSGGFYFGYYDCIFNPMSKPVLIGVYGFDPEKDKGKLDDINGLLNMCFSIGAMVGVLSAGFLSDKFGRRAILYAGELIALLTQFMFTVVILEVLLATRFLSGVVAGLNSAIYSIMIAELLPNSLIGFGNGFAYMLLTFATVLAFLSQNFFSYEFLVKHWVFIFTWPAIVSVFRLISFAVFIRTDTPKYIYLKNPDAEESLAKIKYAYSFFYIPSDADIAAQDTLEFYQKDKHEGKMNLKILFGKRHRKQLLSGCFVAFAQQISGINFFCYYSTRLFDEIGGYGAPVTFVVGLCNFAGSVCVPYFISRFGRKFNLVVGPMFQTAGMIGLYVGYFNKHLPLMVTSVIVFMVPYAIGLGGTITAYVGEILPPMGVGISFSVQWLMTALVGQFLPRLMTALGQKPLIIFFAVTCFLIVFMMDYLTIETKGKTEERIANDFQNKKYRFMDFL